MMYPGDKAAQQTVLAHLTGHRTAAGAPSSGPAIATVQGGFWDTAWKYTKCAAYLAAVFVPGAKAYKAIKALGGIKKTAQLLIGAGSADDFLSIAGGAAAEIIGLNGITKNCF